MELSKKGLHVLRDIKHHTTSHFYMKHCTISHFARFVMVYFF